VRSRWTITLAYSSFGRARRMRLDVARELLRSAPRLALRPAAVIATFGCMSFDKGFALFHLAPVKISERDG